MSERERWIVYPLLFLALGVALRDELFDQTRSKRVLCEELIALQENPTNPAGWLFLGGMGPPGSGWEHDPAMGQLRIGTIRAETVIADRYAGRGTRIPPPWFLDLWRRPWASFSKELSAAADEPQDSLDKLTSPAADEPSPASARSEGSEQGGEAGE